MRDKADNVSPPRLGRGLAGLAPYALLVGAVVLGWQIAIQPLIQRAPVGVAVRIAPGSPLVLRRAAEAELAAGRTDNAAVLGRDALGRSPFDVRALRVVGLTESRAGRPAKANDLLTLAGNWSLRDDPAHAWLVEYRLRNGDYASAFAHADTLVRRREDMYQNVFSLFTIAATQDPQRALPVLASLLSAEPPWRSVYLSRLTETADGLRVGANLAVLLQGGRRPLTRDELQRFYLGALERGQLDAIRVVRARLGRPAANSALTNGRFDDPEAPAPFQWELVQAAGAVASIMPGDLAQKNPALRVEYDGYTDAIIARQLLMLAPGRYRFRVESRIETGNPVGRMAWTIKCASSDPLFSTPAAPSTAVGGTRNGWVASTAEVSIPAGCPGQWLDLVGLPLDSRAPMVVWFDRASIVPVS